MSAEAQTSPLIRRAAAEAEKAVTTNALASELWDAEAAAQAAAHAQAAAEERADVADARADAAERALAAAQVEAKRLEACLEAAQAVAETFEAKAAQAAPVEAPSLSLRSRGKRILVLEGGGQKAYAMYALLRKLESLLGLSKPLAQFYDLVCGTSAGGASACVHAIEPNPLPRASSSAF